MKSKKPLKPLWAVLALAIALVIGASSQNVWAQTKSPEESGAMLEATAVPVPQTSTDRRTVSGVACVDSDRNGLCSSDEARIPNVVIRVEDGSVTATDNSGAYTIAVPSNATLDVNIPAGYKSLDGNPRIQVIAADRIDIALAIDTPIALPTLVPPAPIKIELPKDILRPNISLDMDLRPVYYTLAAIGAVILLSQLMVSSVLRGVRKTYQKSLDSQNMIMVEERSRNVAMRLQDDNGWQVVAEQLVADALSEPIAIDSDAGILDATTEPAPRFTVAGRDGREFTFTIDPNMLKKQRLLQRGDKVLKVSSISPRSHADVSMLWEYVLHTRRLWRVTPPSTVEWYVAVRGAKKTGTGFRVAEPKRSQLPSSR